MKFFLSPKFIKEKYNTANIKITLRKKEVFLKILIVIDLEFALLYNTNALSIMKVNIEVLSFVCIKAKQKHKKIKNILRLDADEFKWRNEV